MSTISGYNHNVAAHCEAGSMRNLLNFRGMDISEEEVFGIASGPQFYFLKFVKTPSGMPLTGIRNRPGHIIRNIRKFTGIDIREKSFRTPLQALSYIDENISKGIPTATMVDMFYMKYLPSFLHVHAPFHFIIVIGREEGNYLISDPYSEEIGKLDVTTLSTAMSTNAKMSRDNFCVTTGSNEIRMERKQAYVLGIKSTCRGMFLPPKFIGPKGIRMYAESIRKWPEMYSGSRLRDGAMLNAVAFEEQGTGGAAFRLMYASFLSSAAELFKDRELETMSIEFQKHGQFWQDTSRQIISTSKPVPLKDEDYEAWVKESGRELKSGFDTVADRFDKIADFENDFFRRLSAVAGRLL